MQKEKKTRENDRKDSTRRRAARKQTSVEADGAESNNEASALDAPSRGATAPAAAQQPMAGTLSPARYECAALANQRSASHRGKTPIASQLCCRRHFARRRTREKEFTVKTTPRWRGTTAWSGNGARAKFGLISGFAPVLDAAAASKIVFFLHFAVELGADNYRIGSL